MFIKERCEVAGGGMGLATNLGFPYLELSLLLHTAHCTLTAHSLVCASLLSSHCNMCITLLEKAG